VRRAKYEIRLGRVRLERGVDACERDDHEQCQQFLSAYLELIRSAWKRLQGSGRQAVKQPQGFKELDIALREDMRLLDDLKHRIPLQDRDPVEKTGQEADRVRDEVLRALFPAERPHAAEKKFTSFHLLDGKAKPSPVLLPGVALLARPAAPAREQKGDFLTEDEEDKLRETQDPAARIEVYLDFEQARLARFDTFRSKPADAKYDTGTYLDKLLGQYIALNDEMKSWIDDQYQRQGDMRRGLRALLGRGPQQLEQLRRIQQSSDPYSSEYAASLRDAMDQLTDTLDGAAKALSDQEKKFGELRREEKATARASKERVKEEQKRTKEEKKLRKRQSRSGAPADSDQD